MKSLTFAGGVSSCPGVPDLRPHLQQKVHHVHVHTYTAHFFQKGKEHHFSKGKVEYFDIYYNNANIHHVLCDPYLVFLKHEKQPLLLVHSLYVVGL